MRCVESRRARWSVGLCFADQQILEELRQGFSDDSQCKRGTLLCAPHGSAPERYDIVREKLQKRAWAPAPDAKGLTIAEPPRPRAHARDGTRHALILRNNKPPHRRRFTPTAQSRIKPLRRLGRAPCSALPSGSQSVGASSPSAFRVPLQAPVDPCTGCGLGRRRRMPRALHPQSDAGPPAPPKGEATRSQSNAVEGQATTRVRY